LSSLHGDNEAQVNGDRLIQGKDFQTVFLDLNLHAVDLNIHFQDPFRKLHVPLFDAAHRPEHILLDYCAKMENLLLQAVYFPVQMNGHLRTPFSAEPPGVIPFVSGDSKMRWSRRPTMRRHKNAVKSGTRAACCMLCGHDNENSPEVFYQVFNLRRRNRVDC
jgi:hypothetical protein